MEGGSFGDSEGSKRGKRRLVRLILFVPGFLGVFMGFRYLETQDLDLEDRKVFAYCDCIFLNEACRFLLPRFR